MDKTLSRYSSSSDSTKVSSISNANSQFFIQVNVTFLVDAICVFLQRQQTPAQPPRDKIHPSNRHETINPGSNRYVACLVAKLMLGSFTRSPEVARASEAAVVEAACSSCSTPTLINQYDIHNHGNLTKLAKIILHLRQRVIPVFARYVCRGRHDLVALSQMLQRYVFSWNIIVAFSPHPTAIHTLRL